MYSCDPCDEFFILVKLNLVIVVTLVKLGLCSSEIYDGCCGKKNERK